MPDNTWTTGTVRIDGDKLIIDGASPEYGNRKKWTGKFVFRLTPADIETLKESLEEWKTTQDKTELAKRELQAFKDELSEEYQAKLAKVLNDLGLEQNDLGYGWNGIK